MPKELVVLSGGMDSTTLLYDVIEQSEPGRFQVEAITFDYNQRHKKEIVVASKTCEKLNIPQTIIDLSILNAVAPSALTRRDWDVPHGHYEQENMKETVVPNRNMVMLSLAVSYAIGIGARKVYYGAHHGDHAIYPDCRKEFVLAMKSAIALCDWNDIVLEAPYIEMDKGEILKKGIGLDVNYSLTWTCYEGEGQPCGECGSCVERAEAFSANNESDPLYGKN